MPNPLTSIVDGTRRAARSLARTPGFSLTVVLILGLAIGMSSAIFAVFEGLVLRELPIAAPSRVVTVNGGGLGAAAEEIPVSLEQLSRFRQETSTLAGVAGFAHWGSFAFAIRDGDRPLTLRQAAVTGNFFDVLGASPVLGRLLDASDDRDWAPADDNAAGYNIVLSHRAWRTVFGGDPHVIGRRLRTPTNRWDPVIVGVAPPGLDFPRGTDYWIPANYNGLNLVGRLRPGASYEGARLEYQRFIDTDPGYADLGERTLSARVDPLAEAIVGDVRPALLALTAAVALLLLLACINIGNLLLVRATGRLRDVAIRRALGARALRVLRDPLAESALLAVSGGVLGLVVARLLLWGLARLAPHALPRADLLAQTGAPFFIAAAVTALALLLSGVLPALGVLRADPMTPLRADARAGTEGRRLKRVRQALVAGQLALALILLAGAGLLLRSFAELARMDFGFETSRLSVVSVALPYDRWVRECGGAVAPSDTAGTMRLAGCAQARAFVLHDRLEERLAASGDVAGISTLLIPPFLGASVWMTKVVADHQLGESGEANPWFGYEAVGPDFFRTLQLPVVRGRAFTRADMEGTTRVAVVSEGVARALWPGEEALGRRFGAPGETSTDSLTTVIGIVPDVHYREHRAATPTIYRPYRQAMVQGYFVVRTRGPLQAVLPALGSALREIDADLVVAKAETMDELIDPQLARPRLQATLLAAFAIAAVLIAAIGLYGVMAHSVAQRRRELGVRMALGATPADLRAMVLRQAARITLIGGAAGVLGALAASRIVASLLFRVSPVDPVTFASVTSLLLGIGLAAAYVPALRATRTDPLAALHAD